MFGVRTQLSLLTWVNLGVEHKVSPHSFMFLFYEQNKAAGEIRRWKGEVWEETWELTLVLAIFIVLFGLAASIWWAICSVHLYFNLEKNYVCLFYIYYLRYNFFIFFTLTGYNFTKTRASLPCHVIWNTHWTGKFTHSQTLIFYFFYFFRLLLQHV